MMTGKKHRFAYCAILLLAGCSRGSTEEPSVVLERAATTAQQLQSASFDVSFSYDSSQPDIAASGTAEGTLAEGGRQLSFHFDGDMTTATEGPDQTVSVKADVVVADENETYLKIESIDGNVMFLPGIGLVPDDMLDRWFFIGSSSGASTVTPDPSFLEMQTQSLTVLKDRGYEDVDGRDCYAYDVTIDRVKMAAFFERIAQERGQTFDREGTETFLASYEMNGTIWIDAETSVIRRISWNFENAADSSDMSGSFTIHFTDHNEPVEISPPAGAVPISDVLPTSPLPLL